MAPILLIEIYTATGLTAYEGRRDVRARIPCRLTRRAHGSVFGLAERISTTYASVISSRVIRRPGVLNGTFGVSRTIRMDGSPGGFRPSAFTPPSRSAAIVDRGNPRCFVAGSPRQSRHRVAPKTKITVEVAEWKWRDVTRPEGLLHLFSTRDLMAEDACYRCPVQPCARSRDARTLSLVCGVAAPC